MAAAKMLRVRARGDVPVLRHDAAHVHGGPIPYIGRQYDAATEEWPATGEDAVIADTPEHRRYVVDGHLWAADAVTAARCEVKFDPAFGKAPKASTGA